MTLPKPGDLISFKYDYFLYLITEPGFDIHNVEGWLQRHSQDTIPTVPTHRGETFVCVACEEYSTAFCNLLVLHPKHGACFAKGKYTKSIVIELGEGAGDV